MGSTLKNVGSWPSKPVAKAELESVMLNPCSNFLESTLTASRSSIPKKTSHSDEESREPAKQRRLGAAPFASVQASRQESKEPLGSCRR